MPAVRQDRKLHLAGPPVVEERVNVCVEELDGDDAVTITPVVDSPTEVTP